MNIFLPVEWINRELDSRLLLITELLQISKKKRLKIYIGEMKSLGKFSSKINDYFLWLASGIDNSIEFYLNLAKRKGVFLSLDEEGGIFTKNAEKNFPRHKLQSKNSDLVSKIFIWGKDSKNKIKKDFRVNRSLVLSGNPRFDLAKTKFAPYYKSKKYNKDVLINAAFGTANSEVPIKDEILFWLSRQRNRSFSKSLDNKIMRDQEIYQKKNFLPFLSDIKKLVKLFPNLKFGIRPHPVENKKTYSLFFKNIKNVEILNNKDSALNNIINSKIIIHNGCTTAIESLLNNKKTICHINYRDKFNEQYLPVAISELSTNFEDLKKNFEKFLKKKNYFGNLSLEKKLVSRYIHNISENSYKIISNQIVNLNLVEENNILHNKLKKKIIHDDNKSILFRIEQKIINIFKRKKLNEIINLVKKRSKRKFGSLPKNLIKEKLEKLKRINKYYFKNKIQEVDRNCFCIERD